MKEEALLCSETLASMSSPVVGFGVIQWARLSVVLFLNDEESGHYFVSKFRLREDGEQNRNVF